MSRRGRYLSDIFFALGRWFQRRRSALDGWIDRRFGGADPDGAVARSFKTDAEAIEEAPVPLSAHIALFAVLTFLVIAIVWSIVGTVDRIVVAQGKIATRTPLIVMSPYTTSRIQQVRILPGDVLPACEGYPLVERLGNPHIPLMQQNDPPVLIRL